MKRPFFSSIFSDLDAVGYFFASSGLFILVTAAFFSSIGALIGFFTWGRYKRRLRLLQDELEAAKSENAQLKRRAAELAKRPAPQGPTPTASTSPLAALVRPQQKSYPSPGRAFSVWTEEDWVPAAVNPQPLHASHAFSVWTEATWKPAVITAQPLHKSAAFSVWTEAPAAATPAPEKPQHTEQAAIVAAAASAVRTVAAPSTVTAIATPHHESTLEVKPAPAIDDAKSKGSIFARAVAAAQAAPASSNGESQSAPQQPATRPSVTDFFRTQIQDGRVRNDFLLGVLYRQPPEHADDLARIVGLPHDALHALHGYGVHTFEQISYWSHDQAEEFARRLGLKNRHEPLKWVAQAEKLVAEKNHTAA